MELLSRRSLIKAGALGTVALGTAGFAGSALADSTEAVQTWDGIRPHHVMAEIVSMREIVCLQNDVGVVVELTHNVIPDEIETRARTAPTAPPATWSSPSWSTTSTPGTTASSRPATPRSRTPRGLPVPPSSRFSSTTTRATSSSSWPTSRAKRFPR